MAWNKRVFQSNGSFVAPPGVKEVLLYGFGGGGGGGGGARSDLAGPDERPCGGGGGAGATPAWARVPVTPGTSYAVATGDGGDGGAGATSSADGTEGNDGDPTFFNSALYWLGGTGGRGGTKAGLVGAATRVPGGKSSVYNLPSSYFTDTANFGIHHGDGGFGFNNYTGANDTSWSEGKPCAGGYAGGTRGANGTDNVNNGGGGGGSGGGGPLAAGGNGGNGGNGVASGQGAAGTAGASPAAFTGAGGGGGGAGGQGVSGPPGPGGNGGNGGAGSGGMLVVYWWT